MSYTLMKGLGWFVLALALGVLIGWLLRSVIAGRQIRRARSETPDPPEASRPGVESPGPSDVQPSTGQPSAVLSEASNVLGREVAENDLTLISGINTSTAELCRGIGIGTWGDLASTEVSLLQTMLVDAGPRSRALDPSDWPAQARLLSDGCWQEFKDLGDPLVGDDISS